MKKFIFVILFATTPLCAFADATSTATITIRDGSTTAFSGIVELAASTTLPVNITPTNSTSSVSVAVESLLVTLLALDVTTTDFNITDLAYFSSFNSFIINCIAISAAPTTNCFNWTYAVNGTFPQVGIDHQTLQDGDVVYLFFGPPRQTVLSTTTTIRGEPFTATAQTYDLQSGNYVGASYLTIGVGTSNQDFSFTELATSTSDVNGEAIFTLNATGTFAVGIQEDFYFPTASITITDASATTTETTQEPAPVQSSGGGGSGISHAQLDVSTALAYLMNNQHADGSFDSPLLSDWVAIAFAAQDPGVAKTKLREYLLTATPSLSSVTDYERHAMALLALGINPYSGTPVDYIAPIINAFDGTQIGDLHLDNDDIFALFPLFSAGYGVDDVIIQKTTAFILSAQNANGSWDESVDMTSAAVQALSLVQSLPNVSSTLTQAKSYLHSQQQNNGGFGNSFSTSWALQAIRALGESPNDWAPASFTPQDYLVALQQSDGGVEPVSSTVQNRVWATAYAIPALLEKTWSALLQSFARPSEERGSTEASKPNVKPNTEETSITTPTSDTVRDTPTPPLLATSTPPVPPILSDLSSPTVLQSQSIKQKQSFVPKTALQKEAVEPVLPTLIDRQVAAVANASIGNFFSKLWNTVVGFFSSWL